MYACCVFSQPRVSREHRGARWGHCCYTKPSQLLLPAYAGKPLQLANESFYFTATQAVTLHAFFSTFQNIIILRDRCLISSINICFNISTTLKSMLIWCFIAGKLCFWPRYVTQHCVSVFKMEMVNPMKNKKCNHHYDEGAILGLIKTKQSQKKKCR